MKKINKIYEKSIDLVSLHERMYPSDGTQGLPVGDKRSEVATSHGELVKWHINQLGESKKFFADKMGLKHA